MAFELDDTWVIGRRQDCSQLAAENAGPRESILVLWSSTLSLHSHSVLRGGPEEMGVTEVFNPPFMDYSQRGKMRLFWKMVKAKREPRISDLKSNYERQSSGFTVGL
jgi:hypothetical protein